MSLPGVQGHTDTGGWGLLSKRHQSPWNRKGWFHSNRHLSWRQPPGSLTGCLTLLGTGARDSTTSNSMKGACRKPGGMLPTRPRARLLLLVCAAPPSQGGPRPSPLCWAQGNWVPSTAIYAAQLQARPGAGGCIHTRKPKSLRPRLHGAHTPGGHT